MFRIIVLRLLVAIPVMFGVLLLGFLLMQAGPTDAAVVRAGPNATEDVINAIRQEMGLDKPLYVQFGLYVWRLMHADFGISLINNVPVINELMQTIGPTLELMFASLVWAIPLGIGLGTLAARYQRSLLDRSVMAFSVAGVSVPVFFIGLLLVWGVGFKLQWLPFTGRAGPLWTLDGLKAVILPALTLGGVFVGPVARMTRSAVVDVLGADHVRTARAKGLSETVVMLRHALRNAMIPVVTLLGLQIGFLLGGAVVTETIFSWPGVGRLAVGAILSSDFPMAQGTIIILALGFIVINLTVDILYTALDPRLRG
ncbi:peptide ABC transporter [Bordetella trematum]|uniref:ABC transporter permease n=1 Tax=Bordetella trematum TaxID=123899 RepID=A0A157RYE0_9BORD|nr:ABC transporter permease [Bordetella trematum]AUL46846.1 peptide ABC transporter [Bordetella trematum]AZR93640.1 peptide ABC transporter [Bordetella trematum]NNH17535.1 ABC transporter permease [Bordetella trematum]QIM72224.1 ABC transporter permease [Bordetella trematum]SAI60505.1 ABC transporter permease [Bordetella trematum]